MKHSKRIALLAMLLLAASMLTACFGKESSIKLKSVLDGSLYEASTTLSALESVTALKNTTPRDSSNDTLITFYDDADDYDKIIVFNAKTNSIVYTDSNSKTVTNSIDLGYCKDADYFTVTTKTYEEKNGAVDYSDYQTKTALYGADGVLLQSVNYNETATTTQDLLAFAGKIYRAEGEKLSLACEKSSLEGIPTISEYTEEYYLSVNGNTCLFYDNTLSLVSTYTLPGYAVAGDKFFVSADKLLVQYRIALDDDAKDYDILSGGKKYDLVTLLISAKNGKAKSLKCGYIFSDGALLEKADRELLGVKEKFVAGAIVTPIVDQRIDTASARFASVSKAGKISFISDINDLRVSSFNLINKDFWKVDTAEGLSYLVDAKGNSIGEITNLTYTNEAYILTNGKVYDYSLTEKFNYLAEGYTLSTVFHQSILFKDASGEYVLFTNGSTKKLTDKNDNKTFYTSLGDNCFAIRDASDDKNIRINIYNENGRELKSFSEGVSFNLSLVAESETAVLIAVSTYETETSKNITNYHLIR